MLHFISLMLMLNLIQLVLESKENKNVVREEVQSNLGGDDEPVVHKV